MSLVVQAVSKRYKSEKWVLKEISLTLRTGVFGLLGPNGAGKSTFLSILATLLPPTTGSITWEGVDIHQRPEWLRHQLGYLPQEFGVYPHVTTADFLGYMATVKGLDRRVARQRLDHLLDLLHLRPVARKALATLSGGTRQRVGIAQALLGDPKLLIIDEPTAGLDPAERVHFRHLLSSLASDRLIILSSHIVSDVEAVAGELGIMKAGRLLIHTTPDVLLESVRDRVWEVDIPEAALPDHRERYAIGSVVRLPGRLHIRLLADRPPADHARRGDDHSSTPSSGTLLIDYGAGDAHSGRVFDSLRNAPFPARRRRADSVSLYLGPNEHVGPPRRWPSAAAKPVGARFGCA